MYQVTACEIADRPNYNVETLRFCTTELVSLTYFARGALTISTLGGEIKKVSQEVIPPERTDEHRTIFVLDEIYFFTPPKGVRYLLFWKSSSEFCFLRFLLSY